MGAFGTPKLASQGGTGDKSPADSGCTAPGHDCAPHGHPVAEMVNLYAQRGGGRPRGTWSRGSEVRIHSTQLGVHCNFLREVPARNWAGTPTGPS